MGAWEDMGKGCGRVTMVCKWNMYVNGIIRTVETIAGK
jgi:hypothetical protein